MAGCNGGTVPVLYYIRTNANYAGFQRSRPAQISPFRFQMGFLPVCIVAAMFFAANFGADCRPENGNAKTRGLRQLYFEGNFKVRVLEEIDADRNLKATFGWASKNRKLKFLSPICDAVYCYTLPPPRRPPVNSPPIRNCKLYVNTTCHLKYFFLISTLVCLVSLF